MIAVNVPRAIDSVTPSSARTCAVAASEDANDIVAVSIMSDSVPGGGGSVAGAEARAAGGNSRTRGFAARNSAAPGVELLQEVVGGELDLLVAPLGRPVQAGDQADAVDAPEVAVDERVAGLGLVVRARR